MRGKSGSAILTCRQNFEQRFIPIVVLESPKAKVKGISDGKILARVEDIN